MAVPKDDVYYTYNDYLNFDDDKRYELIDGAVYAMSAPANEHQWVQSKLIFALMSLLPGAKCRVFGSPFDVRLNADDKDDTVFQPDVTIVCDLNKLEKGRGCAGVPDMVIEILSPSTGKMDKLVKRAVYLRAGVQTYWIVDADRKIITEHSLVDGSYEVEFFGESSYVPVPPFNAKLDLKTIFNDL